MTEPRLLRDITSQPESLASVLRLHSGEGREILRRAASLVRSARRVVITGMGASLYAATPLYYRLAALGLDAAIVESGELLHFLQDLAKDAVAIAVSRSGESVEVVKLIPALRRLGCLTVGVTNDAASALARGADCALATGSLPDEMVAIQSYTGTLLALHLLAADIGGDFAAARDEAERLIAALPEYIAATVQATAEWDRFFHPTAPVHLLARGPSSASASEGALLFGETAKAAAFSMHAASFRHGHVEMVDSTFRGLIFAPPGRARSLNLALARDVVRFGGQVRVIGAPGQDAAGGLQLVPAPAAGEYLSPLAEIIPVQVAALRLAQLKGLTPGVFRYAPQVTRDEAAFAPLSPR
jgi:glucosamine--fructose-6-phosphate aminotransferase (isomerizing)